MHCPAAIKDAVEPVTVQMPGVFDPKVKVVKP